VTHNNPTSAVHKIKPALALLIKVVGAVDNVALART